jgi:SAM-dependent methyltransferase|tara:strand:- start:595 stop:1836 length:1242 start_codon:yes stop_codon:yes gene_type:complete
LSDYKIRNKCGICSSTDLISILNLGKQPPANSLIDDLTLLSQEVKFPLRLGFCKNCCFVQLLDIVNKEFLFKNYLYMTSGSKPIVQHFNKYAKDIHDDFLKNDNESTVLEIGSNDGSLLLEFKKLGCKILGIEPAQNLAKLANELNISTQNSFFSSNVAKEIIKSKKISVVVANNVVGHIEDLHDFMNGIKILIGNDGIFIFEVPYLNDLIKKLEFDTIYHEHLSYFSLLPIINWVNQYELEIFDIKKQSVHGGTIRVFITKKGNIPQKNSVKTFLNEEHNYGLDKIETYEKFAQNVLNLKSKLLKKIMELKSENKSIIGYGAPAKGNVLLNYCNIDHKIIDFIIDTTPLKQGKFTPGTHIPIYHPSKMENKGSNDVSLLLAWNYKNEILENEKLFRDRGGKFLIPIPEPTII